MTKSTGLGAAFSDRSARLRAGPDPAGAHVAVMILGMHRSGTSALTRILSLSGYTLPETLMDAASDNEEGFWESRPIADLNDFLLAEIGSSWDDPFAYQPGRPSASALNIHLDRAIELIRSEFPARRAIVLKDPRITVLYSFWVQALRASGYEPAPVVCVRNPLEVAASLTRRNGFPVNKSLLVWLSYQLAAERATRDCPRAFVMYEDLLTNWRGALDHIEQSLGLQLERRDLQAEVLIEQFLRPDLRHHRASETQLLESKTHPGWVGEAYAWFSAAARTTNPDPSALAPLTAEYERQRRWFGPVVADLKLRHAQALDEAGAEKAALEQRVIETHTTLQAEIAARDAQIVDTNRILQAEIAARDAQIIDTSRVLQTQIEAGKTDNHDLRVLLASERADWDSERSRRTDAVQQLEHSLAQLVDERDALHGRILDISQTYEAQMQRREGEVREQIGHALDVLRDVESENLRLRALAVEKTHAHARLVAEHDALLHSTLWRATRPLRGLARRAPWAAKAARAAARVGWSLATLRFLRSPAPTPAANPLPDVSPLAAASFPTAAAPFAAPTAALPTASADAWSGRAILDPEPIARFLAAEQAEADDIQAWRDHCRQFPLPVDLRSPDKPQLDMSDAQAETWLARCRAAGAKLRPVTEAPDVSIIIPVYNQIAFTLSAIASIYAQRTRLTYEIILGDDGSSDQTRTLNDASLPRVRVSRYSRNQGFIGNCNTAAEIARGRILIFLNNDVVVLPGWLDELAAPIVADASVGFAGSKLLYADGSLQEAGGIVWRDGSAWNFGRGQDPRDPRYCYAREVDYVSGASIAVPADLWRRLGGFDGKTYEIAYYEDVDLAFRVRQAGLKVLYQPMSSLVHFEGASSGVDLSKGMKRHQTVNAERFLARWRDTLQTHRPNGVEPARESERRIRGRILVIDAVTPTPDRDAGSLVMVEMLRCFQDLGWRVSFIPEDNLAHMARDTPRIQRMGMEAIYRPYLNSVASFLEQRGPEFDIVLMSRMRTGEKHLEAVRRLAPQARVIFNTVDLHFLREAREAALAGGGKAMEAADRTKAVELGVVKASDVTIVHSTTERDLLAKETPRSEVFLFPWVAEPQSAPPRIEGRREVVFVGGFRHAPNVDGLRWFLAEVWPLVRARQPAAALKVIGAEAPREIEAHDGTNGVAIMGWVSDLDRELARARVSVAPLRYGAGVKGKVVSALCAGVPVVCTTIASEGMGLVSGRDVLVEDDAGRFADAVIRLLADDETWLTLSSNGMTFVTDNYSPAVARRRIFQLLGRLGLGNKTAGTRM